jgi:hypothetical protein
MSIYTDTTTSISQIISYFFVSCYFNQKLQNVVFQQSHDVNLVATIIPTMIPNTNLVCVRFMKLVFLDDIDHDVECVQ